MYVEVSVNQNELTKCLNLSNFLHVSENLGEAPFLEVTFF